MTFSCAQIDLRKARKRGLATLDEKSTSSGNAERYARINSKARTGGGRDDTCDHGLSRSWKVEVCQKKKEKQKKQRGTQVRRATVASACRRFRPGASPKPSAWLSTAVSGTPTSVVDPSERLPSHICGCTKKMSPKAVVAVTQARGLSFCMGL